MDWHQRLHPPLHVAGHPVGAADEDAGLPAGQAVAVAETVDSAVLEEPADDALDADVLGQTGDARPQAADAADHAHHGDASIGRLIEMVDQLVVDEAVHFEPDRAGFAGLGEGDFRVDQLDEALADGQRAEGELVHLLGLGVAGHVVEQAGAVAAEVGVGGEEAEVGVDARGDRMVIAGAEMGVGAHQGALAADDKRELGVGLQLHEAIDDLDASRFHRAGQTDVGLLVEASAKLDHRGDRLAGLGPPRSAP